MTLIQRLTCLIKMHNFAYLRFSTTKSTRYFLGLINKNMLLSLLLNWWYAHEKTKNINDQYRTFQLGIWPHAFRVFGREPSPVKYNFKGMYDLLKFIKLIQESDLSEDFLFGLSTYRVCLSDHVRMHYKDLHRQ